MAKINDTIKFENRTSDPSSPTEGEIYYNSTDKKLKFYDGSSFLNLGDTVDDLDIGGINAGPGSNISSSNIDRNTFETVLFPFGAIAREDGTGDNQQVDIVLEDGTNSQNLVDVLTTGTGDGDAMSFAGGSIKILNNNDGTVDITFSGENATNNGTSTVFTGTLDISSWATNIFFTVTTSANGFGASSITIRYILVDNQNEYQV